LLLAISFFVDINLWGFSIKLMGLFNKIEKNGWLFLYAA